MECKNFSLNEICCNNVANYPESDAGNSQVNNIFKNNAARKAFSNFLKHVCGTFIKTSISALIKFDAMMIDAVDELSVTLEDSAAANNTGASTKEMHKAIQKIRIRKPN